jgi:hypothetical protein
MLRGRTTLTEDAKAQASLQLMARDFDALGRKPTRLRRVVLMRRTFDSFRINYLRKGKKNRQTGVYGVRYI